MRQLIFFLVSCLLSASCLACGFVRRIQPGEYEYEWNRTETLVNVLATSDEDSAWRMIDEMDVEEGWPLFSFLFSPPEENTDRTIELVESLTKTATGNLDPWLLLTVAEFLYVYEAEELDSFFVALAEHEVPALRALSDRWRSEVTDWTDTVWLERWESESEGWVLARLFPEFGETPSEDVLHAAMNDRVADPDDDLAFAIAENLVPRDENSTEAWLKQLRDSRPFLRKQALQTLQLSTEDNSLDPIVIDTVLVEISDLFYTEYISGIRAQALLSWIELDPVSALSVARRSMEDSSVEIRRVAVQVVANGHDPADTKALLEASYDSDLQTQAAAFLGLGGRLGDAEVLLRVLSAIESDPSDLIQSSAIGTIEKYIAVSNDQVAGAVLDSLLECTEETPDDVLCLHERALFGRLDENGERYFSRFRSRVDFSSDFDDWNSHQLRSRPNRDTVRCWADPVREIEADDPAELEDGLHVSPRRYWKQSGSSEWVLVSEEWDTVCWVAANRLVQADP